MKAVSYRKWLKQSDRDEKQRKIPKPSETKWSFYHDVLDALMSQIEPVEKFLPQDKDFQKFKTTI